MRGGLEPEVQVEADEDRLATFGLTLDDLARALRAENVNRPGGTIRDWGTVYLVRPDQTVAGRWRRFDAAAVRDALARATCRDDLAMGA